MTTGIWGEGTRVGVLVALLSACASENETTAADGVSDEPAAECPGDYLAFTTGEANGLTAPVKGTDLQVRLLEAEHQPPRKDYNTWTIAVRDADGEPATDAVVTWACAWMKVHEHGTNPKRLESLGDGKFSLVDQNLSMFGPWEIQLWLDPSGTKPAYKPQGGSTQANGRACTPSFEPAELANTELTVCVPRSIAD
jgi:hypothetical protein